MVQNKIKKFRPYFIPNAHFLGSVMIYLTFFHLITLHIAHKLSDTKGTKKYETKEDLERSVLTQSFVLEVSSSIFNTFPTTNLGKQNSPCSL